MNTLTRLFTQLFFVNLIMFVPTQASTLQNISPTTDETISSDKPKEPRTVVLQVPLDKHGVVTVHLTPTEKEKLKDYLDTTSMDKFLATLLEAIRDKELTIRNAARDAMSHLFVTEPSLANTKTLQLIGKHFLQGDADLWLCQGLDVLTSFAERNHKLAPAGVKLGFKIIEKQMIAKRPVGLNNEMALLFFISKAITFNPNCVSTLIQIAEKDMKVSQEDRNGYYRYLILFMLGAVEPLKVIEKNPAYIQALFKISFTYYPDHSNNVNFTIKDLFSKVEKMNPAYSKDIFETLLHKTRTQIKRKEFNEIILTINKLSLMVSVNAAYAPEVLPVALQLLQSNVLMSTRSFPILASIVDIKYDTYDQQVFHALLKEIAVKEKQDDLTMPTMLLILRTLIERHPALAKEAIIPVSQLVTILDYDYKHSPKLKTLASIIKTDPTTLPQALKVANQKLASTDDLVCSNGLALLTFLAGKDPAHYEPIFQLAADLVTNKNWRVRFHALRVVEVLVGLYPACEQRTVSIASQAFQDKEIIARKRVLFILQALVKANTTYIPQVCEIARQAVQDRNEEIRRLNISLLAAILQAEPSYAQEPSFKSILEQAQLDKNKDIRKLADNLSST
ncbi:hypothetical protein [Candidatus Amoebophilus asiaticus]|nr:hypothetical protein [Candidatus Amoebophilus asiaticus]